MTELTIRICIEGDNGELSDGAQDFELSDFGGFLPVAGDLILDPGVSAREADRSAPENRTIWVVKRRVFNPRDLQNYVALIVAKRQATSADEAILPIG